MSGELAAREKGWIKSRLSTEHIVASGNNQSYLGRFSILYILRLGRFWSRLKQ